MKSPMTRRKDKKEKRSSRIDREQRISKLLERGWIRDVAEVPEDAIPVDPDRLNLGGSYHKPVFFRDQHFTCRD